MLPPTIFRCRTWVGLRVAAMHATCQVARNGRRSLGGKLFTLGEAVREQFDPRLVATPYLTRLRDQTRQTALLSIPGNGEPIVVSCAEYIDRLSISSRPGDPLPHCSSQGGIVLAFAKKTARKRIVGRKHTAFGAPPARPLIATLHRVVGTLSAELNCRIYYERGFMK